MLKRLLSLLLALTLVLAVLPQTALLAEPACAHEHTAPFSNVFENTRGSYCYMLWLMSGCPESTLRNPFADVSESDYYYQAVLWAVEKKITVGTSETTFHPNRALTRAQAVTFLWRSAGSPEPAQTQCPYTDADNQSFYYKALLWASGIEWLELNAVGTSFNPDAPVGCFEYDALVCEDCGQHVKTEKLSLSQVILDHGTYGDNLEWSVTESTLTITGSGEMRELGEYEYAPWYQFKDNILKLSLPDGLTTIGSRAFIDCYLLQSVSIPDGVEYIGAEAFARCHALTAPALPESLLYIDEEAFAGCSKLGTVTVPGGVIHIGNSAFASCGLTKVTLCEGVQSIGDDVFMNNYALRTVSIPRSVIHVGYNAFGAGELHDDWEDGILYMDGWAIEAKGDITEAKIRPGTRGIADETFDNSLYLTSVTLPDSLLYIGVMAFAVTDLTELKLPSGLLYIYDGAFSNCIYLEKVNIPKNLAYLGEGAFFNCLSLTSVTIPSSLTAIEPWTFAYGEALTHVDIPAEITYIGDGAFFGTGLTSITVANKECVILENAEEPAFMLGAPGQTTVYGYPDSTAAVYAKKYGYRFVALNEKLPFIDVPVEAYYSDPVVWALENNVTTGADATHFSPDKTCTRAQVVTFLWRAAGSPEPEKAVNPFTDVKPDAYYYKAVLWAVEKGVTTGTSADKFSPDKGCTRAQVVTFQWRAKGKPEPSSTENPFTDVAAGQYYYKAVLWAVEKEITKGTSADKFSPDSTCTRGQIVTFLYRDMK